MYSSAVFTGVDLFALKIYLDRVVPISHSWHQRTRDTGLADGEDRNSHASAFPGFDTIPECDGQNDGCAACSIYSACKLALRRAVKTPKSGRE